MKVSIYIETGSTALRKMRRECGYVLECIVNGAPVTRHEFFKVTDTLHGATVQMIEKALIRIKQPCEIEICAPDSWVLNMLESNMPNWVRNNFLNAKGEPIANQKEWMHIWLLIDKKLITTRTGPHQYSAWMKKQMKTA